MDWSTRVASQGAKQVFSSERQPGEAGFTIIEALIVLGIGGLIFSLVFLAIPALVRTGHNNQRKQDVASVLQAVANYELNNSANFPANNGYLQYTKLTMYDVTAGDIVLNNRTQTLTSNPPDPSINANVGTVQIYNYAKCDPANPGAAIVQGSDYRDIVALYGLETAGGSVGHCQQI
jgi:type II secretory pathway pseudopilin PulG